MARVYGETESVEAPYEHQYVVVTNFDMPFGSMVIFMIKWAIASIPAAIILFVLGGIVAGALTGIIQELVRPHYPY